MCCGLEMNNRRENFVRLAEARTTKVLHMIAGIGNLSNRGNYEYELQDVEKIFSAIDEAVKRSRARFRAELESKNKSRFKL